MGRGPRHEADCCTLLRAHKVKVEDYLDYSL